MTTADLTSTCPVCGAEESLDSLLHRMIDDESTRRLLADIVTMSLPLGGKVVRYLRLHKPAKHALRLEKVAKLLAELVPDMRRGSFTAKGRDWQAPHATWSTAFDEVLRSAQAGTLDLPLTGNGYLYAILVRLANSVEAEAERARDIERQQRAWRATEPVPMLQAIDAAPAPAPEPTSAHGSRGAPAFIRDAQAKLNEAVALNQRSTTTTRTDETGE